MDAKRILDQWLDDADYQALAQEAANAYAACDGLMSTSAVLSDFPPGRELRGYLLGPFVQHSLTNVALIRPRFNTELKANEAKNCTHLRLHKAGELVMTAHYLGGHDLRDSARPAVNRASLASRNYDLFADDDVPAVSEQHGPLYCQLLHGGTYQLSHLVLAIPAANQREIVASCELPIPASEPARAEQILEEMAINIRKQLDVRTEEAS
jgi:hypothetical protein